MNPSELSKQGGRARLCRGFSGQIHLNLSSAGGWVNCLPLDISEHCSGTAKRIRRMIPTSPPHRTRNRRFAGQNPLAAYSNGMPNVAYMA